MVNIQGDTLLTQYRRAKTDWPFIETAEQDHGLPALLLYAVGSRETNLRNIKGDFTQRAHESSPRFHGFGVWQRDSDAFGVDESYLKDVPKQARDAAELLAANHQRLGTWEAAVAAYNCGAGNVLAALAAGLSVDHHTAGGDYSADVLARLAHLVAHAEREDLTIADDATKAYLDRQFASVRDRVDRAVQRVGGRTNSVYNNRNEAFSDLVMSEEALAGIEAARKAADRAAQELAAIKARLHIQ
ncbi:MAG TPA: transglycosylase SLT domain-containing protein [Actinomycetes bacterium]